MASNARVPASASSSAGSSRSRRVREKDVVPKVEFPDFEVDPQEAEAYWRDTYNVVPPPPGFPLPRRAKADNALNGPSKSSEKGLRSIRGFAGIPAEVEFRLPVDGEEANSPPAGYFTSYEDHIRDCFMWFPIPEAMIMFLNHFGLSIGQVAPSGIQCLVGLLVLSFERGLSLGANHLRAMLKLSDMGEGFYTFKPRAHMKVIEREKARFHGWRKRFFFVRLDRASVEEGFIPNFRCQWSEAGIASGCFDCLFVRLTFSNSFVVFAVRDLLPPIPADTWTIRDLLRSDRCHWNYFSPQRVRLAVERHKIRMDPEEMGPEADDFVPYEQPPVRQRSRSPRNAADDGGAPVGCEFPDTLFGDDVSQMPSLGGAAHLDDLLASAGTPNDQRAEDVGSQDPEWLAEASREYMAGLHTMDKAVREADLEARAANFRVGKLAEENSHLRGAVAEVRCREDERAARLRRERRRGKRETARVAEERSSRRAAEFREYCAVQQSFVEYRECRGAVGALYHSSQPGFSYDAELEANYGRMRRRAGAESVIPRAEERALSCLGPIPVSPDSVEIASSPLWNDEEVDQMPSFRVSGYFDTRGL